MMYKGRIVMEGAPREFRESKDPVVHQFIHGIAKGPITEAVDNFK
jgi:phospholipid/cholesterol/gamma-HCH transport system ATP-binding protein